MNDATPLTDEMPSRGSRKARQRARTVRVTGPKRAARPLLALAAAVMVGGLVISGPLTSEAGATTYTPVNGQGSTYAALAFQTWTQSVQLQGLDVNYTATGSPAGLAAYENNTADFAGTEAEYSELYADTKGTPNLNVPRGFAYTPDVAGAISIMYHVALTTNGHTVVTYLHLTPLTIAKIFLGVIKNWDSPTISAENKTLKLPNEPITVDFRSGQSGTTALFYDFVKHEDPTDFRAWAENCHFNPTVRIWEIDDCSTGTGFARTIKQSGSDQQAQYVSSATGLWSIGYDEFGYAKVYHDDVAWVENAAGDWTQPYAVNIAAALQSAVLAPDTSQTLAGVYTSTNPLTYPISAYSYILYQCAPTATRPTCKKPYSSTGVENTIAKFMRFVACTGQVKMATIGYSPLPAQLSQFLANAIGYMTGQAPTTLTAQNCANPQFQNGSLGVGATPPPDPTAGVTSEAPGAGGASANVAATSSSAASAGTAGTAGTAKTSTSGGAGSSTTTSPAAGLLGPGGHGASTSAAGAVGAAAASSLPADPVVDTLPVPAGGTSWPIVALVVLLVVPVALLSLGWRRRSRAGGGSGET